MKIGTCMGVTNFLSRRPYSEHLTPKIWYPRPWIYCSSIGSIVLVGRPRWVTLGKILEEESREFVLTARWERKIPRGREREIRHASGRWKGEGSLLSTAAASVAMAGHEEIDADVWGYERRFPSEGSARRPPLLAETIAARNGADNQRTLRGDLAYYFFKRKGSDRSVHAGVLTHSAFGVAHHNRRLVVDVAVLPRCRSSTLGGGAGGDATRATGCDNEQRYPDDTGEPLSSARILSRTTLRATLLRDRPGDYYLVWVCVGGGGCIREERKKKGR